MKKLHWLILSALSFLLGVCVSSRTAYKRGFRDGENKGVKVAIEEYNREREMYGDLDE